MRVSDERYKKAQVGLNHRMSAMLDAIALRQHDLYAESLAVCKRAGSKDPAIRAGVEQQLRTKQYWLISRPFVNMITQVYAMRPTTQRLLRNADGTIEGVEYEWTDDEQRTLDEARHGLEQCASICGLTLDPTLSPTTA